MIPVSHFGFHLHDNLPWLHEQAGGRCLVPALQELESPLEVSVPRGLRCPHRLQPPEMGPVLDHPLVRAMGPDQDGGLFHVYPVHANWLWRLSAMTPGLERTVEPAWCLSRPPSRWVARRLGLTNVAPLAIVDLSSGDFVEMERMAEVPRTRNLILSGPLRVPGAVVLEPDGLDWNHDWSVEGRRQLYNRIRRSPA
ncbi:hypothetical protein [Methylorubrum suomiense]|uniref:Uncharacterized protein n=1 Tax=Methylorubrum suomiense TaxID=144191 RepID=A0ABQ4V176_9HYPH|nr:hypothetical protein [Methylorubrum suomiense]GJE78141.1 hypothetical protein BGCPKDLD_4752 [Methylorubrum suomiense]